MSIPIHSSEGMQQWDKFTIEHEPIASIALMERAAGLACKSILGRNYFNSVSIFCGPGNNGGDGLVIARLLSESGKDTTVYCLKFAETTADFEANFKLLPKAVKVIELIEENHTFQIESDLCIDAVFGSGLNRSVDGWIAEVIKLINKQTKRTIAIDIPSGLFSVENHTNESFPAVIEADETLTFMSPKMPFFYPTYAGFVGNFRIINISLHEDFQFESIAEYLQDEDVKIVPRKAFAHKGTNGYLQLIAGLGTMSGAAVIAAKAAAKCGAGYVGVMSTPETRTPLTSLLPESIWQDVSNKSIAEKTSAIAIGPGLGTTKLSFELLQLTLKANLPLVLDADAINLLSANSELKKLLPAQSVLTPHIGELTRLVGNFKSDEELLKAQIEFSKKYKVYIIQKGPYSKLSTPEGKLIINSTGNPGMSSAGMGDALTGIIGSFLAQGYTPLKAAQNGMYVHGMAADIHAHNVGEIGLLASDVVDQLPAVMNQLLRTST